MYYDTKPDEIREVKKGIWEFGNRMAYAAREAAYGVREKQQDVESSRAFRFILQRENHGDQLFQAYLKSLRLFVQTTWDNQESVARAVIAIMVVQAIVVLTLLHMFQLKLVLDVERARLSNLLALIGLPGPILRIMHAKPVVILEDDSDDEADEEEDGEKKLARAEKREEERKFQEAELKQRQEDGKDKLEGQGSQELDGEEEDEETKEEGAHKAGGLAIAGPSKTSSRNAGPQVTSPKRLLQLQSVLNYNGKALITSWFKSMKLVLPLFLWQLAVLIVFAITQKQAKEMHSPLASLYAQSRVNAWFAHTRFIALELVMIPEGEKGDWQKELAGDAEFLEHEYELALYGNDGKTSKDDPFPTQPATFASPVFSDLFFRDKGCHREDQGQCFSEEHRYYEATHNGLDAMMRRFIRELKLLAADDVQDLVFTSERMDYIYHVGMYDLQEGLIEASQLFTEFAISRFHTLEELHIALLVVTVALAVGYVYWVTKPYVAAVKKEASHVAGLLSHAPKELDVTSHLKGAQKV
ncbi:hypothetical protein DUNSADRAFT_12249 [Dunaliella salina]|uniref:Uncharacterized protein n=1 Tax=Dunaliella salina TaxID=3046 RepID=A0ABQ7GBL6_DUNSA|nr:hypothetical protein DUNSADRAFT_12249 [Dunaliella salina]|eukprot:KAF5832008.1 hypothetical protein DUNSADRAFT_12249 [Dunaliella salina]